MQNTSPRPLDTVLQCTALAAGAVDVIGFATLGGIFASAMTGNIALLAYYASQGNSQAALGSVVALAGFVLGCGCGALQGRTRPRRQALSLLLLTEAVLLLVFAFAYLLTLHAARGMDHLLIAILSVAMGLQAVIGQSVSQTTIVFTTTLTKLVGTIADAAASRDIGRLHGMKVPLTVVAAYLCGALSAGTCIAHRVEAVVLLPFVGVMLACAVHAQTQPGGGRNRTRCPF